METIGSRIKAARENRSMTQAQLSEKTGLNSKYIGAFECGRRTPGPKAMAQLCSALGVDEKTLRYGEESGSVKPVHSKDRRHTPDYIRLAFSDIEQKLAGKPRSEQFATLARILKAVEDDCDFPKAA